MSHPQDHFSKLAEQYARGRPSYPAALFDYLSGVCEGHDRAWDCATGTGQAAHGLTPFFRQVTATDISDTMLAEAAESATITFQKAAAETSGLADQSVDLITVAQAIHWFDLPAFWNEVSRVVKPGGILAFWAYRYPEINADIDILLKAFIDEIEPYWPARIALVKNHYRDIHPPFTELQSPAFSAQAQWTSTDCLAHLQSWSAVRYHGEKTGRDIAAEYTDRFRHAWEPISERSVSWPLTVRIFCV